MNLALTQLLKITPEKMSHSELNLGMAFLMNYEVQKEGDNIKALINDQWVNYNPINNPEQFVHVLSNQAISSCSHINYDQNNKPNGFWFSAHAFYGGTESKGNNFQEVIGICCVKLLNHQTLYPTEQ